MKIVFITICTALISTTSAMAGGSQGSDGTIENLTAPSIVGLIAMGVVVAIAVARSRR
jgi:hypothetical protein